MTVIDWALDWKKKNSVFEMKALKLRKARLILLSNPFCLTELWIKKQKGFYWFQSTSHAKNDVDCNLEKTYPAEDLEKPEFDYRIKKKLLLCLAFLPMRFLKQSISNIALNLRSTQNFCHLRPLEKCKRRFNTKMCLNT